jgi:hypothetical protein
MRITPVNGILRRHLAEFPIEGRQPYARSALRVCTFTSE